MSVRTSVLVAALSAVLVGFLGGFVLGRSTSTPPEAVGAASTTEPSASPTLPQEIDTAPGEVDETTPPVPQPTGDNRLAIGRAGEDAGLVFKLVSVKEVASQQLKDYYGTPPTLTPKKGAKLIAASFLFLNDGKQSVDIWCAFDLGSRLIDSEQRQYDPVDQLYLLAGNTDCNEAIQPGFRTSETVVFEVPRDSKPSEVDFWNPNDGTDYFGEATQVEFAV
ncbi:MAG: DUF4352 domain-containing protein [Actinomycetota bacterium]|nr:DUF4352 domain-containing protein [Actinomycetota bacterium]